MPVETLWLRKILVVGSFLIYWAGVLVQVHRVRKMIGRSPNIKPRGSKEKLLWAGWFFVIVGWIGQPFLIGGNPTGFSDGAGAAWAARLFSLISFLFHPAGIVSGVLMILVCYGGTLWSYTILGRDWRIGISRHERTYLVRHGPYQWVRHPIYLFQIFILGGVFLLVPTPFSCLLIGIHFLCVFIKAVDEEAHLLSIHGSEYRAYLGKTGRFLPRIKAFE